MCYAMSNEHYICSADQFSYTVPRAEFLVAPPIMVSGSWPKAETLSQCFTLVRWFHDYGAPWSGTPSELAFTIATAGEGTSWFRNSDDLVRFIEANSDMLRDLGVEASIRNDAGRITVDFKSSNEGQAAPATLAGKLTTHLEAVNAGLVQPDPIPMSAPEPIAIPPRPAVDLGSRLHDLIDEDANKVTPYEPPKEETPTPPEPAAIAQPAPPVAKRTSSTTAVVAVLVVLALAALTFFWRKSQTAPPVSQNVAQTLPAVEKVEEKPAPSPTPSEEKPTPAATQVAPTTLPAAQPVVTPAPIASSDDPAERQRFDAALAAATSGKQAAPQYDLAMRYAEGSGVAKDNAQAFAWLTIAEANGSAEATSALSVVQPKLSQDELQRARIAIANAFSAGTVVGRNYVQAYRWLMKAEHDGSHDAAVLRKELETRMFAWQIIQAGGTPPSPEKKKD